jgi:hypothetical protein
VVLTLIAAACGGGLAGANAAPIGTSSTSKQASSSNGSGSGDRLAYSACMRAHGVPNFPDPDSEGHIRLTPSGTHGVNARSPLFRAAQQTCQRLLQNGGRPTPAQQAHEQQQLLRFAHCMRSHGVPNFPDPTADGALNLGRMVGGRKVGVDPNTPQFRSAQHACQKLAPGGPGAPGPQSKP